MIANNCDANMNIKHLIEQSVKESITAKTLFIESHLDRIESCARQVADRMEQGKKLLLFGNGGSAADSQHIAAEFVNRLQMERRPLPAIALTTDTSIITAIGNDYSYDDIFLKQVQALGGQGDIALGITTSGNSPNVIKAIEEAKSKGMLTIGFSGDKGRLKEICDFPFCVPAPATVRIQEVHIMLAHILCDIVERLMFDE